MEQCIVNFHQDAEQDWVAELKCGHFQHMRHKPPWVIRTWVISTEGREAMKGQKLKCKKCDSGAPPDSQ